MSQHGGTTFWFSLFSALKLSGNLHLDTVILQQNLTNALGTSLAGRGVLQSSMQLKKKMKAIASQFGLLPWHLLNACIRVKKYEVPSNA